MNDSSYEFEEGIKYGLFICRNKPHLLKTIRAQKPHKDDVFTQGIKHGIQAYQLDQKRKQLAASRTTKTKSHGKER